MSIIFILDLTCLAFFGLREMGVFHWLKASLVSGSYPWWPEKESFGHFQSDFSTPGTKSYGRFLVLCEQAGNKLRDNTSHVQIHGQNPLTGTPAHTCSFWDLVNCVPMILVDFFSKYFDILFSTTCWWVPRMRVIFNAYLSSFEPRKPLENLCTAQFFLLKRLLKHFMCFCGLFRDGNKISSRFAVWYGLTSRFRKRSLTTLGGIDYTSPYNILRRRLPDYWLVKGATTLT